MDILEATERWPKLEPDPRNIPQCMAFYSKADILLFGGRPHGGKTFLQILLTFLNHRYGLVIRRSFPELESGIINDSKKYFPVDEKYYNQSKHLWSLPDKRRIVFGHGEKRDDFTKYKGPNWDYIGIDEASEIKRFDDGATPIDLLLPWNRTTAGSQRVRMVLTSNPGGVGEEWLIEWFAPWLDSNYPEPAKDGALRFVVRGSNGKLQFHKKRIADAKSITYIASSWKDNPYTMDGYEGSLRLLPLALQKPLLEGIWGTGKEDDLWQVIPSEWIKAAQARWVERPEIRDWDAGGIDVAMGGNDRTVLYLKRGSYFAKPKSWEGKETKTGRDAAEKILPYVQGRRFPILIDTFGVGAKAYGELRGLGIGWAQGHFGNEKTDAKDEQHQLGFANSRSEAVWRFREALDPNSGLDIALSPDRKLFVDLCSYRWYQHAKGIGVRPKEWQIKELGRSPDDGDAAIMCWYAGYKNTSKELMELYGDTKAQPGKYEGLM